MTITDKQLARHFAAHRALLREYFPRADQRVIDEYVEALRAYDHFPAPEALTRLVSAHDLIAASVPTIELEPMNVLAAREDGSVGKMSTRKAREADEARRKAHRAHMKHVLGLDDAPSMKACRGCGRGTHGRFCYWCGKRRGLW